MTMSDDAFYRFEQRIDDLIIARLQVILLEMALRKADAWFVKDFADGWIHFDNQADAKREADETGAAMMAAFKVRDHG
jgi:hypothetical protein